MYYNIQNAPDKTDPGAVQLVLWKLEKLIQTRLTSIHISCGKLAVT